MSGRSAAKKNINNATCHRLSPAEQQFRAVAEAAHATEDDDDNAIAIAGTFPSSSFTVGSIAAAAIA